LTIVQASLLAATYAALVYVLPGLSFLTINVRIANMLRGLIPFLGWPAVIGLSIGVFIANLISPLGPIDLLSVIVVFCGQVIIYCLRKKSVLLGLFIHYVLLATWISWMISTVTDTSWSMIAIPIFSGIFVSDIILPYVLFISIKKFKAIPIK